MRIRREKLSSRLPAALLLLFVNLIPAAAGAAHPKVSVERSRSEPPRWISRVPEADENYLYFVGRASGAKSLEDAESDAAANALSQIVTTIGVQATLSYDRLRREAGLLLQDRLTVLGEAQVTGLKRLESYYEKQTVSDGETVVSSYSSSLLVRYPRQSLEREVSRLEQEAAGRVQQADERLAEALSLEKADDLENSFASLIQTLALTAKPAIHAKADAARNLELCRNRALEAARRLSLRLRKVAVEPVEAGDSASAGRERGKLLTESLEQTLLSQGFHPEKGETVLAANILPRVSAVCREEGASGLEAGFCFSRWTAACRITDPRDDSLLFAGVYTAKGFGLDPERAGQDAVRKLRVEIFNKFAKDARDKFDLSFAAGE